MNRIKFLREGNNMTQQELADKIGGAKSTIAMYEKEDRKPSLEVLLKLSEIFNCSTDYILGISDIRNPENVSFDSDTLKIGLSTKDYENITEEQKKQIEDFAKFVLKDNKIDKR